MIAEFAEQALAHFPIEPIRITVRRRFVYHHNTAVALHVRHDNEQFAIARMMSPWDAGIPAYRQKLATDMAFKLARRVMV